MGVFGCGCPNLTSVVQMGTANFAFMNSAPNSASAAELITALIFYEIFRTAPLFRGISLLLDMKKCPLARFLTLASDRYYASLWIARIISDAWKVSTASSCEGT